MEQANQTCSWISPRVRNDVQVKGAAGEVFKEQLRDWGETEFSYCQELNMNTSNRKSSRSRVIILLLALAVPLGYWSTWSNLKEAPGPGSLRMDGTRIRKRKESARSVISSNDSSNLVVRNWKSTQIWKNCNSQRSLCYVTDLRRESSTRILIACWKPVDLSFL